MKAIVYRNYGPPNVLELEDFDTPTPKPNEVLVKVHAASINSWDGDLVRGRPYIVRMWGIRKPRHTIPGADIAGRVETVGANVTQLKPGDNVYGDLSASGWGGFAEYVCAPESALAIKPDSMAFDQAASIPQAGTMALQSLRHKAKLQPGEHVLINGAGGAVGTFAIQIARAIGAEITAVDRPEKLALTTSLGADHVIEYTTDDFTANAARYDLILDVVGNHSISDLKRALTPTGRYIMIGGPTGKILQIATIGTLTSIGSSKKLSLLPAKSNLGLVELADLFNEGRLTPFIDSHYPLDQVPEAFHHYSQGHVQGKIVITITP